MPDPPAPAVSVVVPAHDAALTLATTLRALLSQSVEFDFEVIVVDSASRDGTLSIAQRIAARDPRVRVLTNPGGEPAGSRNLGVAAAAAELIAFTDADCEPAATWLAAGVAALAGADLVQGRVLPAGPRALTDRTLSVGHESGLYETANLFVRRAGFERAGGFTPLPGFGEDRPFGEDTWFAWRVRRTGARTAFCAEAEVHHAVFPRGAGGFIAEQRRCRYFPALVRAVPELRQAFLYRRLFLSPRSARFDLAVVGVTGAGLIARHGRGRERSRGRGRARALALAAATALPYAGTLPRRPRAALVQLAADAVAAAALLVGSLGARTPVL
jgi:hypothetical protein